MVSDYDCPCAEASASLEELLTDSESFTDLDGRTSTASPGTSRPGCETLSVGLQGSLPADRQPEAASSHCSHLAQLTPEELQHNLVVTQLSPKVLPGCFIDSGASSGPALGLSLTISLNGLLGTMEAAKGTEEPEEVKEEQSSLELEGEPDLDSFPILVRSMSTSRRHSWGVPVSPINLGRR